MKVWIKEDSQSRRSSFIGKILTFVFFVAALTVFVVAQPVVNFYFYTGTFPGSEDRSAIFDNLKSQSGGLLLSSMAGGLLCILTILGMKYSRFAASFFAELEAVAIFISLTLFSTWLIWKYNPVLDPAIITVIPFFLLQLTVFLILEGAGIMGQGGRIVLNFISLGGILGALVGAFSSINQAYFYFGGANPLDQRYQLGVAFGHSLLDTSFFFGAGTLTAACICKSKIGGSIVWHFIALIIPIGLACAFSAYVEFLDYVPVINNTAGRYILAVVIVLVTSGLSMLTSRTMMNYTGPTPTDTTRQPIRGQVPAVTTRNAVIMV